MTTENEIRQHMYSRPRIDPDAGDSLAKIVHKINPDTTVLDIGCAVGELGRYLSEKKNCIVDGIEFNHDAAELARSFNRQVWEADLDTVSLKKILGSSRYQYIVCADVLEHLRNPGQILKQISNFLTQDGKLLVSIPNIGYIGIFLELLSGDFKYREEGILDQTHLRFFTQRSFLRLLAENGFTGRVVDRTVADLQQSEFAAAPTNAISPLLLQEMQGWHDSLTYQFIIEAHTQNTEVNLTQIISLDQSEARGPRFTCQIFWRKNGEAFTEAKSQCHYLPLGAEKQNITFSFPKGAVNALRLDLADRKGFLHLYSLRLNDGVNCVWSWDGDIETLFQGSLHSIFPARMLNDEFGVVVTLLDEDPWIVLPIPHEILFKSDHLEVELSWPMSTDYIAVKKEWENLLTEKQELSTELKIINQSNSELITKFELISKNYTAVKKEWKNLLTENQELSTELKIINQSNSELITKLELISNCRSMKLTKHLRIMFNTLRNIGKRVRALVAPWKIMKLKGYVFCLNIYHCIPIPNKLKNVLRTHIKQHPVVETREDYMRWIRFYDTLTEIERETMRAQIKNFPRKPLISVVMPTYNTPEKFLRSAIESVRKQIYPHWELCIVDDASSDSNPCRIIEEYAHIDLRIKVICHKVNGHISKASNRALSLARGEYIVLLDHDDTLSEEALYWIASRIMLHPDAEIIYSDEDRINETGTRSNPFFKPDWSPHLAVSQAYMGHLVCISAKIISKLGVNSEIFDSSVDGSQDYDLWLRAANKATSIHHIPKILYHWREHAGSTALDVQAKPYTIEAGRKAVQRYVSARYPENSIDVIHGEHLLTYALKFSLPEKVFISILIPTRNGLELLSNCIDSIISKSAYTNYEIIIIDNGSDDASTLDYLQRIQLTLSCIRVLRIDEPFNWSRINNIAAIEATGDVLIFLNNDTIVISENWLESLAGYALLPDVGTVGALLLFEDGNIQHAGVVIGMGGWANHIFHNLNPKHSIGPFVSPIKTRNVMANTGACLAIERKKFEELGRFDEEFIICGSDVELGLRAHRKGYFNVFCAEARLYHLESKTRDPQKIPESDFTQSDLKYKPYRTELVDPFFNPNLDLQFTSPTLKK